MKQSKQIQYINMEGRKLAKILFNLNLYVSIALSQYVTYWIYIYVYNTNTNLKYISTIFQRQNDTYITDHIHIVMSHPLGLCYAAAYQHPKIQQHYIQQHKGKSFKCIILHAMETQQPLGAALGRHVTLKYEAVSPLYTQYSLVIMHP